MKQPLNPEKIHKWNKGSTTATSLTTVESGCIFCDKSNHLSCNCFHLKKMSEESIKSVIQKAGVCFKCLKPGHIAKNCGEQCSICGKGHHKVICRSKSNYQAGTVTKAAGSSNSSTTAKEQVEKKNLQIHQEPENEAVSHVFTAQSVGRQTILQTARVKIQGQNGVAYCNVLFDTGSDRTYIRSDLSKKLKSKHVGSTTHRVSTFGGSKSQSSVRLIHQVVLIDIMDHQHKIEAIEVDSICSMLQKHELPKEAISKGIQYADMSAGPITIDILVGLDLYWKFMSSNIIRISDT